MLPDEAARRGDGRGVVVHYDYDPQRFFPREWLSEPARCEGEQFDLREARRTVRLIAEFASLYSFEVIDPNLTDIYVLGDLHCYGATYGGTNSQTALYITAGSVRDGYTDSYIYGLLHAEFSSILMRNYDFPYDAWTAVNQPSFEYSNNAVEVVGKICDHLIRKRLQPIRLIFIQSPGGIM
jgi:hypothetical protein